MHHLNRNDNFLHETSFASFHSSLISQFPIVVVQLECVVVPDNDQKNHLASSLSEAITLLTVHAVVDDGFALALMKNRSVITHLRSPTASASAPLAYLDFVCAQNRKFHANLNTIRKQTSKYE